MKIGHFVGRSLVRYTPGRISAYWGRYTEHEGRAFVINRTGRRRFCEPLNPNGFYCCKHEPKQPLIEWAEQCEVIHCHDDCYPTQLQDKFGIDLRGKVLVYHAHIGNIAERYFGKQNARQKFAWSKDVRHAAITNGYGHLFDEHEKEYKGGRKWGRLPDILDLSHPTYAQDPSLTPDINARDLRVCYTYSNHHEDGKINAKRPRAHMRLLKNIPGVDSVFVYGKPFEEAMAEKKRSHVVIEECFTNYLHLSALEGAAVGKCVVTRFNTATVAETSNAVGAPTSEWPFLYADQDTLRKVVIELSNDRQRVMDVGRKCRRWMEKYYSAPSLLNKYLEFYGKPAKEKDRGGSEPASSATCTKDGGSPVHGTHRRLETNPTKVTRPAGEFDRAAGETGGGK